MDNGFVGTEAEWLESLRAQPEPFRSSFLEILGAAQTVAQDGYFAFDPGSIEEVGTGITVDATGTVFTITEPGLYSVDWTMNLAEGTTNAVVGLEENGEGLSGSSTNTSGNFSDGALIEVVDVPYTFSLYNFGNAVALDDPTGWENTALSIRISRFADEAST